MSLKLTDKQIRRRLQEGRNYKRLYLELKVKYDTVVAENRELRAQLAAANAKLDTQAIQIAELQRMVFGRKKRLPTGVAAPAVPKVSRLASSYRRAIPPDSTVTSVVVVPLPKHCACGGSFHIVTTELRYEEDVPLPELTPGYQPHLVTKYVIARGVCAACGRATSGRELGGAEVSLGPNVRLLVADLTARMGLSYSQVSGLLLGLYGLGVTDGEIANILWQAHLEWASTYNQLKANIRAAPVDNIDETSWPIQELQGAGYGWDLCDTSSGDVCYILVPSRGARHAQELLGQDTDQPFAGVRISDDYGAYRNDALPGTQQLCWAHPFRVIRDLVRADTLPGAQRPYVEAWYAGFAGIYSQLRKWLAEPYDKPKRESQASSLWSQLQQLIRTSPGPAGEPAKLTRLKAQLIRVGKDRLLVCLPADTPCDNNRAERDLRQLVLKRKRSFGSKTEKGAQALATVLSLCTTTWRRARKDSNPTGYFSSLATITG